MISRDFVWCAPGDDQRDRWLVRFNDADRTDAVFDNEADAREHWNLMCGPSGTWNGYLFKLATRRPEAVTDELIEALLEREFAKLPNYRGPDVPCDDLVEQGYGNALTNVRAALSKVSPLIVGPK